jgi:hypothetical protein
MANDDRFKWLYPKIDSKESALKVIRESAYVFWGVAGLMAVIGAVAHMNLWLDVGLDAVLAAFLFYRRSRPAAVLLFILSLGQAVVTIASRLGYQWGSGGNNVILAALVVLASISAVRGSFAYHSFAKKDGSMEPKVYSMKRAVLREAIIFIVVIVAGFVGLIQYGINQSDESLGGIVITALGYIIYLVVRIILWMVRKLTVKKSVL